MNLSNFSTLVATELHPDLVTRPVLGPAPHHGLLEPLDGGLGPGTLAGGAESHEGGVVPDPGDVQTRHVLGLVLAHPEGQLAEPLRIVPASDQTLAHVH